MPSRSKNWDRVREIENALAILDRIERRSIIIRQLLWHEGDLETAYTEATQVQIDLTRMKDIVSQLWEELYDQAKEKEK